jgi:hypothetical protein
MGFDQFALVVVNLLPETQRRFIRVHVLQITRPPAFTALGEAFPPGKASPPGKLLGRGRDVRRN